MRSSAAQIVTVEFQAALVGMAPEQCQNLVADPLRRRFAARL
jgi:hypothetical protein